MASPLRLPSWPAGRFGPRAAVGEPPHHYHLQVFALDSMIDAAAGADRDMFPQAARAHVIEKGELVELYQQTGKPPK